jgi:hypothetical protein
LSAITVGWAGINGDNRVETGPEDGVATVETEIVDGPRVVDGTAVNYATTNARSVVASTRV